MSLHTYGKVTVAAAGTPQQVDAASGRFAGSVIIQALAANTGSFFIGGPGLVKATGANVIAEIAPGALLVLPIYQTVSEVDRLWVDAATNGNSAYISVEVE